MSSHKKNINLDREPLAIVGIGCRFPGEVDDADSFWKLLIENRSGVTDVPADRWSNQRFYHPDNISGKILSKRGAFINGMDLFDPEFFGISPREARRMDPQHRWLLQVCWETLEDAGCVPSSIRGSSTGVFLGISNSDYTAIQYANPKGVDVHTNSGISLAIASNRISYNLDLRGPSFSVDTACSSALVAVHLACDKIWSGTCDMALAGGANSILIPEFTIGFSRASMLSPQGECYTFDARANGYVRGEGCGMILIKPLSKALEQGDRVYSVIKAAVTNQDGQTSSMTIPSTSAQELMLRQAYEDAGIAPEDVVYMEAHGTGTPVGDPIEVEALGRVLSENRTAENPCILGSVKTNIGHLESASGVAGLIKGALVLHNKQIPANRNFVTANPNVPLEQYNFAIAQENLPLPEYTKELAAVGVNSFGFGGTNAHVVLQQAPEQLLCGGRVGQQAASDGAANRPYLLPISARSEESLKEYVRRFQILLGENKTPLAEFCTAAATRKEQHVNCLVFSGHNAEELIASMQAWLEEKHTPMQCIVDRTGELAEQLVFVFTGQGSQWWAMGQQLLKEEPVFLDTVNAVDAKFKALSGWSILEQMSRSETESQIHQTDIAQPCIFALQLALVAWWKSVGVIPSKVIGHSVGEVAAAYCAGIYNLEDAVQVIYHRSRLQNTTGGQGKMVAVGLSAEEAKVLLKDQLNAVAVAVVNSPSLVTLAGNTQPLSDIVESLQNQGVFVKELPIDYAFHTHQMEPIKDELLDALQGLSPKTGNIPFISTVTENALAGELLDGHYWWRNVREPVLFGSSVKKLIDSASNHGQKVQFLEIGAHPAMQSAINECYSLSEATGTYFHSLKRGEPEVANLMQNVSKLHFAQYPINWFALNQIPELSKHVELPKYPWNNQSYWLESAESAEQRLSPVVHPFLSNRIRGPQPAWQFQLNPKLFDYLYDHQIWNSVLFPAAGYCEIGLALSHVLFPDEHHAVEDIDLKRGLFISDVDFPIVQVSFDEATKSFRVYSCNLDKENWELNATGRLQKLPTQEAYKLDIVDLQHRFDQTETREQFYADYEANGLPFGPNFRHVQFIWKRSTESLAQVETPHTVLQTAAQYHIHPASLDAFLHGTKAAENNLSARTTGNQLRMPAFIQRIELHSSVIPPQYWAHTCLRVDRDGQEVADIQLYDNEGQRFASVLGFRTDPAETKEIIGKNYLNHFYHLSWVAKSLSEPSQDEALQLPRDTLPIQGNSETQSTNDVVEPALVSKNYVLFQDGTGTISRLAKVLRKAGHYVVVAKQGRVTKKLKSGDWHLNFSDKDSIKKFFLDSEVLGEKWDGIIDGFSIKYPLADTLTPAVLADTQQVPCFRALRLAQALAELESLTETRVFFLTRDCFNVYESDCCENLSARTLVGFLRSANTEMWDHRWTVVDLPTTIEDLHIVNLQEEITLNINQLEVALRGSQRYTGELLRLAPERIKLKRSNAVSKDLSYVKPYRIESYNPGILANLSLRETTRSSPEKNEIEVKVMAGGVNFRDVMKALGVYPGKPIDLKWYGDDFSGVVTQIGSDVKNIEIGDSVVGLAPYAFKAYVCVDAHMVFRKPSDISFVQAATMPTVFLTAHYALVYLARLQTGEKVLIHAGSGGVGQAAIQVAKRLGLIIYATAGTPEKRQLLRDQGVDCVMNSRDLSFADKVMEHTQGEGVDAVLNSLAGDFIPKSLSVLAPFGRFLEIGKIDIYNNTKLGLESLKNNISYFVIDLAQHIQNKPGAIAKLFGEVNALAINGNYQAIKHKVYPITEVVDAFKFIAQGKHIGKVVLNFDLEKINIEPSSVQSLLFKANASYLITGGNGGFGLEVASWMVEQGAKCIGLMSRSGPTSSEAEATIAALELNGVKVYDLRGDVSSLEDVESAIETLQSTGLALKGFVHSAMVLDDDFLTALDEQRFQRVLQPKVAGSWNLHQASLKLSLDHFIAFSSLSALIGPARQANYAAANCFIDGLAEYRKAKGLPMQVFNWGALGGAGVVARNTKTADYLDLIGMQLMDTSEALEVISYALPRDSSHVVSAYVDWDRISRSSPYISKAFSFQRTVKESAKKRTVGSLKAQVAGTPSKERLSLLTDFVCEQVAQVLGGEASQIDQNIPIINMGLDSLMAVELNSRIESELGVNLPMNKVLSGPNLTELTEILLTLVETALEQELELPASEEMQEPTVQRSHIFSDAVKAMPESTQINAYTRVRSWNASETSDWPLVDAVAINYLHEQMFSFVGGNYADFSGTQAIQSPILTNLLTLDKNSMGIIRLPYVEAEILKTPRDLEDQFKQAVKLAQQMGAKMIAITGVLSALTQQGARIQEWLKDETDAPVITTGEAARAANVVKSIQGIIEQSKRQFTQERLLWIGANPMSISALRLSLKQFGHPEKLLLCCRFKSITNLDGIKQLLINDGYTGEIKLLHSMDTLPDEVYASSFIVCVTSWQNAIDVNRLMPQTLLVDYSFPSAFKLDDAKNRLERSSDVLFTSGAKLKVSQPIQETIYVPSEVGSLVIDAAIAGLQSSSGTVFDEIEGCNIACLLPLMYEDIQATLGTWRHEEVEAHYALFDRLGFQPARLQYGDYIIPQALINRFNAK